LSNPFLQLHNEEEFVQRATTGLSSYPTYYRSMRAVNRKGGRILGGVPVLDALSPEAVYQQVKAGTVIVDIRETPCYLEDHIEGSYGIPLVTPLITWAGWVIPFKTPIILIADSAAEREEATRQLIRIGYDDLRGYLEGGVEAWQESGLPLVSTKSVNAIQLKEWLSDSDRPTVLDVRYDKEWHTGHIRGAKHVEAGDLPKVAYSVLQQDHPLVVHCQRGNRSTIALSILERKGYKNIYALEAGLHAWVQAGYEIVLNGHQ
jgi:hydroxyacylglutathione hydrolase